jgi:hypothetical protein
MTLEGAPKAAAPRLRGRLLGLLLLLAIPALGTFIVLFLLQNAARRGELLDLLEASREAVLALRPPEVADGENAFFPLAEALRLLEGPGGEGEEGDYPEWLEGVDGLDPAGLEAAVLLEAKARVLELLRRAAALRPYRAAREYDTPFSCWSAIPRELEIRQAAALLRLEARVCAYRGELAEAFEVYGVLAALARHFASDPPALEVACRFACEAKRLLEELLHAASGAPPEALPAVETGVLAWNELLARSFRFHAAVGSWDSAAFLLDPLEFTDDQDLNHVLARGALQSILAFWRVFVAPGEVAQYRKAVHELIAWAELPYLEARDCLEEHRDRLETSPGLFSLWTAWGLSRTLEELHLAVAEALAAERLSRLALAAAAYRARAGSLPLDLESLVPRDIAAIPIDPFDGKPLKAVPADGGLVLYSSGPDGEDGCGDITFVLGGAFEARR